MLHFDFFEWLRYTSMNDAGRRNQRSKLFNLKSSSTKSAFSQEEISSPGEMLETQMASIHVAFPNSFELFYIVLFFIAFINKEGGNKNSLSIKIHLTIFTAFSSVWLLVLVLDGVSKHGEVGGDLVEKLEQGLLWQLVHVTRLEASGGSTLRTPVLPGKLQGGPLVFTHSQTVAGLVNLMRLMSATCGASEATPLPSSRTLWHIGKAVGRPWWTSLNSSR